jgi:hypothetical protein
VSVSCQSTVVGASPLRSPARLSRTLDSAVSGRSFSPRAMRRFNRSPQQTLAGDVQLHLNWMENAFGTDFGEGWFVAFDAGTGDVV